MGVQPDFIVCRSDHEVNDAVRAKIAHFCDVDVDSVLSCVDAPSIYEVPINLFEQEFDVKVLRRLKLPEGELHRAPLQDYVEAAAQCDGEVDIHLRGTIDTRLADGYGCRVVSCYQFSGSNERDVGADDGARVVVAADGDIKDVRISADYGERYKDIGLIVTGHGDRVGSDGRQCVYGQDERVISDRERIGLTDMSCVGIPHPSDGLALADSGIQFVATHARRHIYGVTYRTSMHAGNLHYSDGEYH